jgi:ubiquitin-conjugating enzyme E2 D/E
MEPPKIQFVTPIYHPNIDTNGVISLDTLDTNWSPVLTITKTLLSIISLLNEPNFSDTLMPDLADLYQKDRTAYEQRAREFTLKYAK